MLTVTADELPRLIACNGSRLMPPAFPAIDDPTARNEGTAAHYMAQRLFAGDPAERLINAKAPNGFVMTADMFEHVTSYLQALDYCGEMEANTSWDNPHFELRGRCDHRAWRPEISTLFVDDFKFGHRIVEPFENWTLISHAVGSIHQGFTDGGLPQTIVLRIHQPRPYHPDGKTREWRIDYDTLHGYGCKISNALSFPSDTLQTGPQCAKCHALGNCPAARAASMNAIDASAQAFSDTMPDDMLSYELDTLRQAAATVGNRLEALEELAKHRLRNGAVLPNYALQTQYANTRWKSGASLEMMTALTGVDLAKPGLVTPAEAKRRGVPEDVIKPMTERPITGTKLVPVSADTMARRLLKK